MPDPTSEMPGLADAITAIRQELQLAADRSRKEQLQFEVGPITMEFEVALSRKRGVDGIDVKVVSIGAQWVKENTAVHRLTVQLKPQTADGSSPKVSSTEREIAPSRR